MSVSMLPARAIVEPTDNQPLGHDDNGHRGGGDTDDGDGKQDVHKVVEAQKMGTQSQKKCRLKREK